MLNATKTADLSKLSHRIETGRVVHTIDGKAYRVLSKIATADSLVVRLANLQGQPVQTPADFHPISQPLARFGSWLKFVLAYNKDLTKIVNSVIQQHGYPTDPKMDWAAYVQTAMAPALAAATPDFELQDEAIYQVIIRALIDRNILADFPAAIKKFPPSVRALPLERQVSEFLKKAFVWRIKEAKMYIQGLQPHEEMSLEQPGGSDEGEETYNILDTEEHGTGTEDFSTNEAYADFVAFRDEFGEWLNKKTTPKSAKSFATLLDIYWEQAQETELGSVKISDLAQEWMKRTNLSFDSLKAYRDKLPSLLEEFVRTHGDSLKGDYEVTGLIRFMLPKKKQKAQPAKASSKTASSDQRFVRADDLPFEGGATGATHIALTPSGEVEIVFQNGNRVQNPALDKSKLEEMVQRGYLKVACIASEFCPQCSKDANNCTCPNKASLLDGKTVGDKQAMNAPQLSPETLDRMYRIQLEGLAQGDCEGTGREDCDCETCDAREELERLTGKQATAKPKCPHCGSDDYGLMPTDFETAKCNGCGKNWEHGIVKGINDPKEAAVQTDEDIHPPAGEPYCDGCDRLKKNCICEGCTCPENKKNATELAGNRGEDDVRGAGDLWREEFYQEGGKAVAPKIGADLGLCSCEWSKCPLGHKAGGCNNPAAHMLELFGYKTRYCQECLTATQANVPAKEIRILSSTKKAEQAGWKMYRCLNCGHEQPVSTNHTGKIIDYCKNCSWKPSFRSNPEHYKMKDDGMSISFNGRTYRPFEYAGPYKPTVVNEPTTAGIGHDFVNENGDAIRPEITPGDTGRVPHGRTQGSKEARSPQVLECCGSITNHHKSDCPKQKKVWDDTLSKLYPKGKAEPKKTAKWKVLLRDTKGSQREEVVGGDNYSAAERAVQKKMKPGEKVVSMTVAGKKIAAPAPAPAAPAAPAAAPPAAANAPGTEPANPSGMSVVAPPTGTPIALPSGQGEDEPIRKTVPPEIPNKKYHMTSKKAEQLKTEQNTPEMEAQVATLAQTHPETEIHENCNPYFEHDQWWVTCGACGAIWSVVDVGHFIGDEGDIDLELVDGGDDSCAENFHGGTDTSSPRQGFCPKCTHTMEKRNGYKICPKCSYREGIYADKTSAKEVECSGCGKVFDSSDVEEQSHESGNKWYCGTCSKEASTEKLAWTDEDEEETEEIQDRLEYLRGELRAERISYEELSELQGLAEFIDPGDVELLEAAGVEEVIPQPDVPIETPEFGEADKTRLRGLGVIGKKKKADGARLTNISTHDLDTDTDGHCKRCGLSMQEASKAPCTKTSSMEKEAFEPDANSGIRGSNDGTYIYQADVWCPTCAKEIAADIQQNYPQQVPADPTDERSYDSDDYPKGPFFDEESDAPEHCSNCHVFLENPLTTHGQEYMQQMVDEALAKGRGEEPHIKEWMDFYDYHPEGDEMKEASPASEAINQLPQRGKPKSPQQLGLKNRQPEVGYVPNSAVAADKTAVTLDELKQQDDAANEVKKSGPSSGEDEGFNVKVTYVKGGIKLTATPSLLEDVQGLGEQIDKPSIFEIMEDFFTNGWEEIRPEDIGALTSGEIFSDANGNVYWHERYQIEDMVEELMNGNEVFMQYGGNLYDEEEPNVTEPTDPNQQALPLTSSQEKKAGEQMVKTPHGEMTYDDADVVNSDDYIPQGEFNPHNVRPWLIHNEYGTLAIVYADNEQDALDEAVDADKLDSCLIPEEELVVNEHGEDVADHGDGEVASRLGNAGEPFDLTYIGMVPLPNQQYGVATPQEQEHEASAEKTALDPSKSDPKYDKHPVIEMLWDNLKPSPGHPDRRMTAWGDKTKQGLVLSVERAVKEGGKIASKMCNRCHKKPAADSYATCKECHDQSLAEAEKATGVE